MEIIILVFLIVCAFLLGVFVGHRWCYKKVSVGIQEKNHDIVRYRYFFEFFHRWLLIEKENIKIASFFSDNFIDHIAIYGYGIIGKALEKDLIDAGITVNYAIDRNAAKIRGEIPVYKPDDELPDCNAIIVTTVEYIEIRDMLSDVVNCPILSMFDILKTLMNISHLEEI